MARVGTELLLCSEGLKDGVSGQRWGRRNGLGVGWGEWLHSASTTSAGDRLAGWWHGSELEAGHGDGLFHSLSHDVGPHR